MVAILGDAIQSESASVGRTHSGSDAIPRQVPTRGGPFVGRSADLRQLSDLWSAEKPSAPSVAVITGAPGIGKTAFATFWARRNETSFPDGTLYVNLRGFDPSEPMNPEEALGSFLRSIGVAPAKIPTSLEDMAALFRSQMAGRKMLIILDNAHSPDQVRPLLPSEEKCRVIVTSRNRMSGLVIREGAHRFTLGLLAPGEAMTLLVDIIGKAVTERSSAAARRLVDLSGRFPLALRIIAERVARSETELSQLAEELETERGLLDALDIDDDASAVRYVFFWSYRQLSSSASQAFRLLAIHPGPDFGAPAAAALLDLAEIETRRRLDDLASVHLIEPSTSGRYLFHDLLRQYALERSLAEDGAVHRREALARVLQWYTYTTAEADRIFVPDLPPIVVPPPESRRVFFVDHTRALTWCEQERANIVAGVGRADAEKLSDIAWKLSLVPWSFYELRKHWNDWIRTHEIGVRNARIEADALAEAMILNSLGIAFRDLRRFDEALGCFKESLRIRVQIGDQHGQAINLNSIGITLRDQGKPREAVSYCEESLAIRQAIGFRWGEAHCYHDLGIAYMALREYDRSLELLENALRIWREIEAPWGESMTLVSLAHVFFEFDQVDRTIECAGQALEIAHSIGNRFSEADALHWLGVAHRKFNDLAASLVNLEESLRIRREIGYDYGVVLGLVELTRVLVDMRRSEDARLALRTADTLADSLHDSEATATIQEVRSEVGEALAD